MNPSITISTGRTDLKLWETSLVVASTALFLLSATLYWRGFSFRKFIYGEVLVSGKKIGIVAEMSGELKREIVGDPEFRSITRLAPLFNDDTLITGSSSTARLKLDDETVIDLGPDTMVKLNFGSVGALGGISRPTTVQVVTGKIMTTSTPRKQRLIIKVREKVVEIAPEATAKREIVAEIPKILTFPANPIKITPIVQPTAVSVSLPTSQIAIPGTPPPTLPPAIEAVVKLLSPPPSARLSVSSNERIALLPVKFRWTIEPAPLQVEFILRRDAKEFKREKVAMAAMPEGVLDVNIDRPGKYEWTVRSVSQEVRLKTFEMSSRFNVDASIESIVPGETLIGGQKTVDNRYRGRKPKDFSITLRWNEILGVARYAVAILDSPTAETPLLTRRTTATELTFSGEDASTLGSKPRLYYRVSAAMKNGFISRSPLTAIEYSPIPPMPTSPEMGAKLSVTSLQAAKGRVLFTWQKTDFTEGYEFELSRDESFSEVFVRRKSKDNALIMKFKKPGRYWWRVRNHFKGSAGPVSTGISLEITE